MLLRNVSAGRARPIVTCGRILAFRTKPVLAHRATHESGASLASDSALAAHWARARRRLGCNCQGHRSILAEAEAVATAAVAEATDVATTAAEEITRLAYRALITWRARSAIEMSDAMIEALSNHAARILPEHGV